MFFFLINTIIFYLPQKIFLYNFKSLGRKKKPSDFAAKQTCFALNDSSTHLELDSIQALDKLAVPERHLWPLEELPDTLNVSVCAHVCV